MFKKTEKTKNPQTNPTKNMKPPKLQQQTLFKQGREYQQALKQKWEMETQQLH